MTIVRDPKILSGEPVVRGTRVPALDVAASVRKGISIERILEAYPSINRKDIADCVIFANHWLAHQGKGDKNA